MKVLSFSAVEILPSLLDKSKTQTIRLLKKIPYPIGSSITGTTSVKSVYTKPRFKVGEKVKLMWNQRSKYKWFCAVCGKGLISKNGKDYFHKSKIEYASENCYGWYAFPKNLGEVEITSVFEIEMGKDEDGYSICKLAGKFKGEDTCITWNGQSNDFSIRDGFKSAYEMFVWFDKKYDLSQPRRFCVYRFRWLK